MQNLAPRDVKAITCSKSLIEKNNNGAWEVCYVPEFCLVTGKPQMLWHNLICQQCPDDRRSHHEHDDKLELEARLLCQGMGWSASSRMEQEPDDFKLEVFKLANMSSLHKKYVCPPWCDEAFLLHV